MFTIKRVSLASLLSTVLFLTACGGSDGDFVEGDQASQTFELADSLNQSASNFSSAEKFSFVLKLSNNGSEPLLFRFNSGQQYDFYVSEVGINGEVGDEVWRWSSDKAFTQATSSRTLAIGETVTYFYTWDQVLSDGNLLPAGSYVAHGYVLGEAELTQAFTVQ